MRHSLILSERVLAVVSVLTLVVAPADAGTITVCWDGSADYLTIQEGIDAAAHGDEVVLCDGRYTGDGNRDLDFRGKAITVRSQNGAHATIIDCQGTPADPHRGFRFHSDEGEDSVLAGVTITRGYAPKEYLDGDDYSVGGAILCISTSGTSTLGPTVTDCTLTANFAYGGFGAGTIIPGVGGGGIYCYCTSPKIMNCAIINNDTCDDGDVDLEDFADFEACLLGPGQGLGPGCGCFDFDASGGVDLADFAAFQRYFNDL